MIHAISSTLLVISFLHVTHAQNPLVANDAGLVEQEIDTQLLESSIFARNSTTLGLMMVEIPEEKVS